MQFKFNFEVAGTDKIPFVDVIIKNKDNGKSTSYRALLDSGAYSNVFHADIARVLDIDLKKIKEQVVFRGVEKSRRPLRGRPYVVEIMVFQKGKSHKFDAYVVFSEGITDYGYGLLGRQGFFDQFNEICFNYSSNKFYLKAG